VKTAEVKQFGELVASAKQVAIVGPDHLDGDSLSSLLALEEILGDLGKTVSLYSAGRVEPYLRHLVGWDRVTDQLPDKFDLAITPDLGAATSAPRMLEHCHANLRQRPWVILDHHLERSPIEGAVLELVDPTAASTTELIYHLASKFKWPLNPRACRYLVSGLYADTLNLTSPGVTPRTVKAFADLVWQGQLQVSEIHSAYREIAAFDADLLPLKGRLLASVEFFADGQVAIVVVSASDLDTYRDRVSPSALIFGDLLWARGVKVAVVINDYTNVKRTSLRARLPIAGPVATQFGGGGHPMAAAFPAEGKSAIEIKTELVAALTTALEEYHEAN